MKLLPAPRHLLSFLLLSSLLWETFLAQTFEFSRGWTNGRKRSLVMTSPMERKGGDGEKLTHREPNPGEDLTSLCGSYGLGDYGMVKLNRLCRHWLSSQIRLDSRDPLEPRIGDPRSITDRRVDVEDYNAPNEVSRRSDSGNSVNKFT